MSAVVTGVDEVLSGSRRRAAVAHVPAAPAAAAPDPFAEFPDFKDEASMEEVVRAVVKKEGLDEDDAQADLAVLKAKRVRTVGNLRVLSEARIEVLGLPPVVTEYLLHVKASLTR